MSGFAWQNAPSQGSYSASLTRTSLPERTGIATGRRVRRDGRWLLDFATCDYLGLARDPRLATASCRGAQRGISLGVPRALGVDPLTRHLESAIARLVGQDAALVFTSTVHAAQDVLPLLAGRHGVVLVDERAYPISWDAAQRAASCGAGLQRFPHNDHRALERMLRRLRDTREKVIVCDGVYVSGDIAPLDHFYALARKYDAIVYVDDAHGVGVLGPRGSGTPAHFNVQAGNLVHVGGLSKGFGVPLAFVAGPRPFIRELQARANSYFHSSQAATPLLSAALAALRVHDHEGDARRHALRAGIDRLRAGILNLELAKPSPASLPIQSLVFPTPDAAKALMISLHRQGIWAILHIAPPELPGGGAVRFVLSAAHLPSEIDSALQAIRASPFHSGAAFVSSSVAFDRSVQMQQGHSQEPVGRRSIPPERWPSMAGRPWDLRLRVP